MSESALSTSAAMLFERNDVRVLEAFRGGDFDYVDAIGEVSEADFFRVITERKILDKLAESYPLPGSGTKGPCGFKLPTNRPSGFMASNTFMPFPSQCPAAALSRLFAPPRAPKPTI